MPRRRMYQAIGGPLCGAKMPMTEDGWMGIESIQDETEQHWYRLCVVYDSEARVARFWHYIGEEPRDIEPVFFPKRSCFR